MALAAASSAYAQATAGNLLQGLEPSANEGVLNPARLTDGTAAKEGSFWDTELTSRFPSPGAFVVFDLGSQQSIAAAWLQGDNNDVYELSLSSDGQQWSSIWQAGPVTGAGLRGRETAALTGKGRYLRVSASGGDGSYSLSEIQVFAQTPQVFPRPVAEAEGKPLGQSVRDTVLVFAVALIALVLLSHAGMSRWLLGVLLAGVVVSGLSMLHALTNAWPIGDREVSLVRGVVAAVAAAAVARGAWAIGRFPAHQRIVGAVLGLCGVIGFLAFYNLGQPQFTDSARRSSTFVHYYDLRQYYTTVKYFREVGYGGMFDADVAAYLEDTPGVTIESMGNQTMRNLRTLASSTVAREKDSITHIKERFTPERWAAYKQDSRYLREAMGTNEFFAMMRDHGANATPVWMSIAYLIFSNMAPSHGGFMAAAVLDLLLLLGMFVAIGRCFGSRAMFVCMVIFGANDFIMFGTNWAGSTLRHDWLAYLGLGACALKRGRWALGGALLAFSTMIRAFPVLPLMAAGLPALWAVWEHWRANRRLPPLAELRRQPVVKVWLGALATIAVLFVFSVIVLPAGAWAEWLGKVAQLSADAHTNHISLRTLIAGNEGNEGELLRARAPIVVVVGALITVLVALAARGKPPEQAAMLGLVLIPTYLYPANYYIHIVFLLPLVAADAVVWVTVLALCSAQYFTVLISDKAQHFYFATVLLFTAFLVVLGRLVATQPFVVDFLRSRPPAPGDPVT